MIRLFGHPKDAACDPHPPPNVVVFPSAAIQYFPDISHIHHNAAIIISLLLNPKDTHSHVFHFLQLLPSDSSINWPKNRRIWKNLEEFLLEKTKKNTEKKRQP